MCVYGRRGYEDAVYLSVIKIIIDYHMELQVFDW